MRILEPRHISAFTQKKIKQFQRRYSTLKARFYAKLLSSDPRESALKPSLFYVKLITYSFIGSLSVGFVILFSAEIDEVALVSGELRPRGSVSEVRTRLSGAVSEILRPDGSHVEKGELILRLNDSLTSEKESQILAQIDQLRSRGISNQGIYRSRVMSLDYEREALIDSLRLQSTIYARLEPLQKVGAIQELQILEQRQKIQSIKSELKKVEAARLQLKSEMKKEEHDVLGAIAELNQRLIETQELRKYQLIKAPAKGVIFDMQPKRQGDVVVDGQLLFKLVPSSELEASVYLTNRDIGLATIDQPADVRIDAYPYTEYGFIRGKLTSIGKDALPPDDEFRFDRFPSTVSLDQQVLMKDGKTYQLQSGQSVSVKLFLRRKKLATLVTDVVDRAFDALSSVRGSR